MLRSRGQCTKTNGYEAEAKILATSYTGYYGQYYAVVDYMNTLFSLFGPNRIFSTALIHILQY